MTYNPKIHHRRSIRLKGYDYSQAGLYFVTICTQHRKCLFGEVVNKEMVLNVAGEMIERIWLDIPNQHGNAALHEFVVMPNHFHGIIEVVDCGGGDVESACAGFDGVGGADMESARTGFFEFMQTFKRYSTLEYIKMVKLGVLPRFDRKIWHRNYWEHIVRDENEYCRISNYIRNNPGNWNADKLNGGIGNRVLEPCSDYSCETWMV